MAFSGIPDRMQPQELAFQPDNVDEAEQPDIVDQFDDKLNTKLTRSRLDRHLTKIHRDHVEMIEEQGINALFLSLGLVEWYEADHSREKRYAPLILVPVVLERTERGGFKLRWDGTDIGSNLSLAALFDEEFGIRLPVLEGDELEVKGYFQEVERAVTNESMWKVDPGAVNLGFFSFAKYLIYNDLSPASWPQDRPILSHGILEALLASGFPEAEDSLPEDTFLDDHRPVGQTNEVFDADGSQTLSILQALQGHSMVIEGPPGTGKSQTIANLIAEFIGQGKKVLFVSEKSAALNVVYDRLKRAGLAGACLELHGTKANKRSFYQHLRETLEQAPLGLADMENMLRKLSQQRGELNTYVHALHKPLESRKISPREAIGRLVNLGSEPDTEGRLRTDTMATWSQRDFQSAKESVEALRIQLQKIGRPTEHPFFGSERNYISPDDKADLGRTIAQTLVAFKAFAATIGALTARLNVEVPDRMDEIVDLEGIVTFVINSPECSGVDFRQRAWSEGTGPFLEALDKGRTAEELRARHHAVIADQGWSAGVEQIEQMLLAPGSVSIPYDSTFTWKALDEAERSTRDVVRVASRIAQVLSVKLPAHLWAMEPHAGLAARMASAPDCRGLQIESPGWSSVAPTVIEALSSANRAADFQSSLKDSVRPDSWSKPVARIIEVLERDGKNIFRRLFGREFKSSRQLAHALMNESPESLDG